MKDWLIHLLGGFTQADIDRELNEVCERIITAKQNKIVALHQTIDGVLYKLTATKCK